MMTQGTDSKATDKPAAPPTAAAPAATADSRTMLAFFGPNSCSIPTANKAETPGMHVHSGRGHQDRASISIIGIDPASVSPAELKGNIQNGLLTTSNFIQNKYGKNSPYYASTECAAVAWQHNNMGYVNTCNLGDSQAVAVVLNNRKVTKTIKLHETHSDTVYSCEGTRPENLLTRVSGGLGNSHITPEFCNPATPFSRTPFLDAHQIPLAEGDRLFVIIGSDGTINNSGQYLSIEEAVAVFEKHQDRLPREIAYELTQEAQREVARKYGTPDLIGAGFDDSAAIVLPVSSSHIVAGLVADGNGYGVDPAKHIRGNCPIADHANKNFLALFAMILPHALIPRPPLVVDAFLDECKLTMPKSREQATILAFVRDSLWPLTCLDQAYFKGLVAKWAEKPGSIIAHRFFRGFIEDIHEPVYEQIHTQLDEQLTSFRPVIITDDRVAAAPAAPLSYPRSGAIATFTPPSTPPAEGRSLISGTLRVTPTVEPNLVP